MEEEKISVFKKIKFSEIISFLYIPFTIIYLELALRIKCGIETFSFFVPVLFFSFFMFPLILPRTWRSIIKLIYRFIIPHFLFFYIKL